MKTFNEITTRDITNPYNHYRDGSSLLGPGMGQYDPIADLNAQRELLGKLQVRGNFKPITKSDLDQIERYADRLFGALDIDVEFTRHFLDRVNDMRNKMQITPSELTRLFKQSYRKHGKTIRRLGPDAEAVINDMKTDINMPFVLNLKGGELELVAKTVMRKKNFQTTNPKLSFEDVREDFQFFPKKLHERITLPDPSTLDMNKEIETVKRIMANRTEKDEQSIRDHDENSFYAITQFVEKHGLKFHDNEMGDIVMQAKPTIGYFKKLFNVSRPFELDKSIKPMGSKTNKTRSYPSGHACQARLVALYVAEKFPELRDGIIKAGNESGIGRIKAGFHYLADYVAGNLLAEKMFLVMNKDNYGKYLDEKNNPRIPRKKGQPAGSKKHSDLYTDENPRGTIHGLKFATVQDARASVKKIENSGKKHAHKIQAAIAMEQRAKEMGKRAEAAVYRAYIEKMKKITKQRQKMKEDAHGFKCPSGYKFDRKLMACVPIKSRFKTQYAYPYFLGGNQSGDQSNQNQNGQSGNGNGANGNGANGNGGNGAGNGNGNGGGESFLAADVRKMPDGRFGVYADKFVKGRRVMTPGGKHAKELKKVYKREKDANDYMAAIMISKG